MGLPSQKRTKSSKKRRASHFALKAVSLNKCPKCGKPVKSHQACAFCGTYKGRQIITLKDKKKTIKQKARERKEKARAKTEKTEKKS